MESEIKCLPYLRLVGETYIFIGAFKDPVRKGFLVEKDFDEKIYPQLILPVESILDDTYFVNSQGILEERKPYCKHCGAKKYIRKGYNWRLLYLENGTPIRVKVKRYECKKCEKKFQVEFTEYWGKFCNFSNKIKNKAQILLQHGWKSLRNIGNDFKTLLDFNISHESVRKALKNGVGLYWLNEEIELSGYYGYDAQWLRNEGKWIYRLELFDIINNMPVACLISKKETPKIVEDFIDISIHPKDRKAIITDLKEDYEQIMRKLGFTHQHCTFHLIKNMTTNLKPKITEKLDKYEAELKENKPKISKSKIKKMRKEKKEEISDEIKIYIGLLYELFHQQTFNKAKRYIELLKYELTNFPEIMQEYLNNNFFQVYRKYLVFLEKPFIGKLESTNNKIENYFGNTLDKHTKRIYRTPEGIFDYIMTRKNGWIENRKKVLTK